MNATMSQRGTWQKVTLITIRGTGPGDGFLIAFDILKTGAEMDLALVKA
jgi:hypothetical protein